MSNSRQLAAFTHDATQVLRECAQQLSRERGIKPFCSTLSAALAAIDLWLEEKLQSAEQAIDNIGEKRLQRLLYNYEMLCKVCLTIRDVAGGYDPCSNCISPVAKVSQRVSDRRWGLLPRSLSGRFTNVDEAIVSKPTGHS